MGQREVDLPQLFSDVSRTVSGIRSMLGSDTAAEVVEGAATGGGIFGGNVCFKACGMEDIQFAARVSPILSSLSTDQKRPLTLDNACWAQRSRGAV